MAKKLLQINVCNNVFSTGKIAGSIGEIAIDNGWDSYIAYGRSYAPSRNIPIKVGTSLSIKFHALSTRIFDNCGFSLFSRSATEKLIKQIEEINPDIIHLHVLSGYYLNLEVLFCYLKKTNVPIVWTIHSCWEITGHCVHYDYEGCMKWKDGCEKCPLLHEPPASYIFDRSRKNYQQKKSLFNSLNNLTIVPVSDWLASQIKESYLRNYPLKVIHNGINIDVYKPSAKISAVLDKYGLNGKFISMGVASTWLPKKGLPDYYKLADKLGPDEIIVLVGLTSKQISQLPKGIVGIERTTNRQELVDLYTAADVILNLSYEESFGLTTVEGFACGTPCIAYDRTASPELIYPGCGFVVKAGDIDGIYERIQTIRSQGKISFTESCRRCAVEHFDEKTIYNQYIQLYNELIKR